MAKCRIIGRGGDFFVGFVERGFQIGVYRGGGRVLCLLLEEKVSPQVTDEV